MQSAYYNIYLKQVFTLAKTMVVKSEVAAETINRELERVGVGVDTNPVNWKYYMNLAGLYYTTDIPMTVVSMDTLEEIEFTKENLEIHRATLEAYSYGSRYYRDLVKRYPTQECLILGILNPVNIDDALKAGDGDSLYYDRTLVEPQERNLIANIQSWIQSFLRRWHVKGYSATDDLYPAAQLGVLFAHLPVEILNIRLESCRTNEAHSFHIREYLASHGRLEEFIPHMTTKQALFLYRNVRYLQRNAGKQSTFNTLLERIITERNLPLSRYDVIHDHTTQLNNLTPTVVMERVALNDHPGDGSSNARTVDDVMVKQYGVARSNISTHYDALSPTVEKMENARFSRLPTKVFESALLDTTDSVPYTKEEALFNHWIYLAANNRFDAILSIPHPTTGVSVSMSAKEAFLVFMYAFNRARGTTMTIIPEVCARRVRKPTIPTLERLRSLVDSKIVNDHALVALRKDQPAMGVYSSLLAFRDFCDVVHKVQNHQRLLYSQHVHGKGRAMMEAAALYHYMDVTCDLDAGIHYDAWFDARGWDFTDLSILDYDLLSNNILTAITGESVGSSTALAKLQENMLKLMERLSSYCVHYLQSINNTTYRILDHRMPRVSDMDSLLKDHKDFNLHHIEPLITEMRVKERGSMINDGVNIQSMDNLKGDGSAELSIGVSFDFDHNNRSHILVRTGRINLTNIQDVTNV